MASRICTWLGIRLLALSFYLSKWGNGIPWAVALFATKLTVAGISVQELEKMGKDKP